MSSKCQVIDEGKIVLKFRIIDGPTGPTPFMRAIELGIFEGSEEEWYESLIGPPVPVAYELGQDPELAVSQKLLTDAIGTMSEASNQAISAMQQANNTAVSEASTAKRAAQAAAQAAGEQAGLAGERATITAELAGIATSKAESADQSARTATSRTEEARLHKEAAAQSSQSAGEHEEGARLYKVAAADSVQASSDHEEGARLHRVAVAESAQTAGDHEENARLHRVAAAESAAEAEQVLAEKIDRSELSTPSPSIFIVDQLRSSVEAASGGRMTVIYNVAGLPSYMHVFPAYRCQDVAPSGELGEGVHPAFMFDGAQDSEILLGAYPAVMVDDFAVSQPGLDPRASINFDNARALCQANGAGFDLMSNLDWAAVSLWCMANGFQPRGNTYYGQSHADKWETGRRQDNAEPGQSSGNARTLTGSGPASWSHDSTPAGIHDLVGNAWEWVSGVKLIDGRTWLAAENGVTDEGQYIDTGFDIDQGTFSSRNSDGASELILRSLIAPASSALAPQGYRYVNAEGERLPSRGGSWSYGGYAGLGALHLNLSRAYAATAIGFRLRFRAQKSV